MYKMNGSEVRNTAHQQRVYIFVSPVDINVMNEVEIPFTRPPPKKKSAVISLSDASNIFSQILLSATVNS
jgi:hypothetical protein